MINNKEFFYRTGTILQQHIIQAWTEFVYRIMTKKQMSGFQSKHSQTVSKIFIRNIVLFHKIYLHALRSMDIRYLFGCFLKIHGKVFVIFLLITIIQTPNCSGSNKKKYIFCGCSIFAKIEIYMEFLYSTDPLTSFL